jgi:hypothetical protein
MVANGTWDGPLIRALVSLPYGGCFRMWIWNNFLSLPHQKDRCVSFSSLTYYCIVLSGADVYIESLQPAWLSYPMIHGSFSSKRYLIENRWPNSLTLWYIPTIWSITIRDGYLGSPTHSYVKLDAVRGGFCRIIKYWVRIQPAILIRSGFHDQHKSLNTSLILYVMT